jgi:hypothetical protein
MLLPGCSRSLGKAARREQREALIVPPPPLGLPSEENGLSVTLKPGVGSPTEMRARILMMPRPISWPEVERELEPEPASARDQLMLQSRSWKKTVRGEEGDGQP